MSSSLFFGMGQYKLGSLSDSEREKKSQFYGSETDITIYITPVLQTKIIATAQLQQPQANTVRKRQREIWTP